MGTTPPLQASTPNRPRSSLASLLTPGDLPWLAMAVLGAVGLRVLWVVYVNVDPNDGRFDDSIFYHNVARGLAETWQYGDPFGRGLTAQWPPAYPATLAVLYKLFGFHLLLAKGLNIAFAAITVALTYVIARRVFGRWAAYLAAVILAFFPGQIYFSTLVYAETMFGMVFMLVLLLALVWTVQRSEARWWQVLLIGFLIGLAGMVRVEGVFLVFVLVALWAVTVRPWRTVARYAVLVALGTVLALTPWTVRNAVQLHQFVPLRTNMGNAVSRTVDPEFESPRLSETKPLGESFRSLLTYSWRIVPSISENVKTLYENDADGIRRTQSASGSGLYQPPLSESEVGFWRGLADRYFFAAGAAALAGATLCVLRRNRASLPIIVAAVGWTLLFGFVTPTTRYHFPVGPLIAIMAAAFIMFAWDGANVAWSWLVQRLQPTVSEGAAVPHR